jgi:hypothetical protein
LAWAESAARSIGIPSSQWRPAQNFTDQLAQKY